MCEHIKRDMIRNEDTQNKVKMASLVDKMTEMKLKWFGHVKRRWTDAQ